MKTPCTSPAPGMAGNSMWRPAPAPATAASGCAITKYMNGEGRSMSSAECVELLREPVAQEGNLASRASQLAADLRQAMKSGADDIVTVQAVDELFGTLCALYAAN